METPILKHDLGTVPMSTFRGWLIAIIFLWISPLFAQNEILFDDYSYRTVLPVGGVGDWNDPVIWEVWSGSTWIPAVTAPDSTDDVFIEKTIEVRLTANEGVRNLYLFSSDSSSKKLNLQTYNLSIYGTLKCYTTIEGEYIEYNSTSPILDWIYPETGNLVFKGISRTIVDRASWSAQNLNSRFGVIFNPEPDDTLVVNSAFKASQFVVQSGTVLQTVNEEGIPATSTFSFNTNPQFGPDEYGNFFIEPGATLVSFGTSEHGEIIRRSENKRAATFHLNEGGALAIFGQNPVIEAGEILLEGDVHYLGEVGAQQFIQGHMNVEIVYTAYNNLFFGGDAVKKLPYYLDLRGNLTYMGGGALEDTTTIFDFIGSGDQTVNTSLTVQELRIGKPSGTLVFEGDVSVLYHYTMYSGIVDFKGNELYVNESGNGSYSYYDGTWKNLGKLNYNKLPAQLDSISGAFPFEDQLLGGKRTVYLSGTNSAEDADLSIVYHEVPGVNWDAGFNDNDGTPILYKLNSHFETEIFNYEEADNLELEISAHNLVVVDERDLRIVSDLAAAPGSHVVGLDTVGFYARRYLEFSQLDKQTFTIGSTGVASILPVTWLTYSAEELVTGNLISWSTSMEKDNEVFKILRSTNEGKSFHELGEVKGTGNTTEVQNYSFIDKEPSEDNVFYQIKQVNIDGTFSFSPVFSLLKHKNSKHEPVIFPNPYVSGLLRLQVPPEIENQASHIEVTSISGERLINVTGEMKKTADEITDRLKELNQGMYLITIGINDEKKLIKWLRK
jgi:hypothetical protein